MQLRNASALAVLVGLVGAAAVADPLGIELRFVRFNGPYENLTAEVEPIRNGPVTIILASPEHRLVLKENQLDLSPLSDELHAMRASLRFSGAGLLIAELDFAGIPASFRDRVVFPEQEVVVEAKVHIERVSEGYLVTTEELPRSVDIEVQSMLGSELVTWCERLSLFVAGDAGCEDLERALSHPRLPLPAPGQAYLVRAEELTSEEREKIDLYLTRF